jgi:hypothetical protein
MVTWLALAAFILLLGGALWLMWRPPSRHEVGGNDTGSVGGDGHYGGSDHGGGGGHGGSH